MCPECLSPCSALAGRGARMATRAEPPSLSHPRALHNPQGKGTFCRSYWGHSGILTLASRNAGPGSWGSLTGFSAGNSPSVLWLISPYPGLGALRATGTTGLSISGSVVPYCTHPLVLSNYFWEWFFNISQ